MSAGHLHWRALAAAALAATAAAGCSNRNPTAVIGLTLNDDVRLVAQQAIDSTHRAGTPEIVVSSGGTPRVLDDGDRGHWLVASINLAAQLLEDENLVAVVGPAGSRDALLTGPMFRAAGVSYVMPTANSPRLANLGKGAFRLAPSLDEEGTFIAEYVARHLRAHTATILYVPDEWGVALQSAVAGGLWFHGVTVLARSPVPVDQSCLADPSRVRDALEAAMRRGTPDVLVLALRNPESTCIIQEAQRLAPDAAFVAGDGTVFTDRLLQAAAWAASRVYTVAFWDPTIQSPESKDFVRQFRALTGDVPTYGEGLTYDAIMLLATAIREVGPDRNKVERYLSSLGRTRPPFRGVTGTIDFQNPRSSQLVMLRASLYGERSQLAAASTPPTP